MKVEDVGKLPPKERFLYWMRERHQIYLRRRAGKPRPWTDDEIMQTTFFTCPYRELDKTTQWFREHVRDPLRDSPDVLMATIIFRWFNWTPTAVTLMDAPRLGAVPVGGRSGANLLLEWDHDDALRRLTAVRAAGGQIFTGAYMINSPGGEPKLEAICRRIHQVWVHRDWLLDEVVRGAFERRTGLRDVWGILTQFDGIGGFMAYEVVCDLRYTRLLEHARDVSLWCNPGPGAVRGLLRVLDRPFPKGDNSTSPPVPEDWTEQTQGLLSLARARLRGMPRVEMREIEMSLCELDKYERVRLGDGKAKRKFNGR